MFFNISLYFHPLNTTWRQINFLLETGRFSKWAQNNHLRLQIDLLSLKSKTKKLRLKNENKIFWSQTSHAELNLKKKNPWRFLP